MSSREASLSPTPELNDENPAMVPKPSDDIEDMSDNDSVLSDVDEDQFKDFDPNQIAIDERPAILVDEDNVKLLGRHKRRRDETDGEQKKKKKGDRREKPSRSQRRDDSDDEGFLSATNEIEGKRIRKKKPRARESDDEAGGHREKAKRVVAAEEEAKLDPEERRRRALDRAMDAALKGPNKGRRRRGAGEDLASYADEEITNLRFRMAEAAEADNTARSANPPKPAVHKLKLLPEVTALLNRNSREIETAIVDPDTNLLESVRFFLEPLADGSMPAYNIQRELFAALANLPIDKESLISSGLGKVVLFYTKSKRPELAIKRAAERLLGEWTRPILKRSDDYRKRSLAFADFDPTAIRAKANAAAANDGTTRPKPPQAKSNRARLDNETKTYTIVPRSTQVNAGAFARPLGASGEDAFRRIKARHQIVTGQKKANR